METHFKTSLKCQGCIDNVSKELTEAFGAENWKVDLNSNPKILIIKADNADLAIDILNKKGYKAESISE